MRYCATLIAFVGFSSLSHRANARSLPDFPRNDWGIGGSVAYAFHPTAPNGLMHGVDVTYSPGSFKLPLWLSLGVRSFENLRANDRTLYPYTEVGFWFFINVGVGYSASVSGPEDDSSGFHWFLGVPLLVAQHLYVEPYYRVMYDRSDALNELGFLVKWTSWKGL